MSIALHVSFKLVWENWTVTETDEFFQELCFKRNSQVDNVTGTQCL
jgi:hypothetical protein